MKHYYLALISILSCLSFFSCKSLPNNISSVEGTDSNPAFLGNGIISFSPNLNIKGSESDTIIYDSSMDLAVNDMNEPYLQIFFSTCSVGSSKITVCVTTLYFQKQQYDNESERKSEIKKFYQNAIDSLKTGKATNYPLYYFLDEATSLKVGEVSVKASWSDKSNYEAQIDALVTNLCKGTYSSTCDLVVSKTGQIEHFIIK